MTESAIDLDKLERLEREATPGPWRWTDDYKTTHGETTYTLAGYQGMGVLSCDGIFNAPRDCDEVFIVALRNAAPALFAELRSARERIAELEEYISALECIAKAKGGRRWLSPNRPKNSRSRRSGGSVTPRGIGSGMPVQRPAEPSPRSRPTPS